MLFSVPPIIEGVSFDGKVYCLAGQRPYLAPEQRCAAVESLEVKHKPTEGTITLKVRTYMPSRY